MNSKAAVLGLSLLVSAGSLLAHHSFAAEYDASKPVTLSGTVNKMEWMNPHIWVYVDVKDEKGAVATWQCEGGAPNALKRSGWDRNSLKPGDQITIDGYLAKDGTKTCNSRSVKLPDGRKVFAGSAEDGAPAAKGKQ